LLQDDRRLEVRPLKKDGGGKIGIVVGEFERRATKNGGRPACDGTNSMLFDHVTLPGCSANAAMVGL
jgi:hypothetical protein